MNNFKRILTVVITMLLLLGLTGCSEKKSSIVTNVQKSVDATGNKAGDDNKINLNNLNITLPKNWMKRGNESELFFDDESKQTVGGISIVGYYGEYSASLPNHSKILSTEDIDTTIGKGKLFTLEESDPAASDNYTTWNEMHAIIPTNKNSMA